MTDDDRGPVKALAAGISTIAATVYAILTGVLTGGVSLIEGLVTLDPSLILSGAWFAPTSIIANIVGPSIAPNIPWQLLLFVAGLAMLAVMFYKHSKKRQKA